MNKIIFKKIKFYNYNSKSFNRFIVKKGLFVFPAAPALASIEKSDRYYDSLKKADLVFWAFITFLHKAAGAFSLPPSKVPKGPYIL